VCFVLTGATGLIYEVLWARMLGLVFGATTFAISTVLAAFMGGLALGSAIAGKLGARFKRPLRVYAVI
jgi:spermidine synthase